MPKFTARQIEAWRSFKEVRQSNDFNMWATQAAEAAGLNKEEHLFCIKNYEALQKAATEEQTS